jgi:hypothetical protein
VPLSPPVRTSSPRAAARWHSLNPKKPEKRISRGFASFSQSSVRSDAFSGHWDWPTSPTGPSTNHLRRQTCSELDHALTACIFSQSLYQSGFFNADIFTDPRALPCLYCKTNDLRTCIPQHAMHSKYVHACLMLVVWLCCFASSRPKHQTLAAVNAVRFGSALECITWHTHTTKKRSWRRDSMPAQFTMRPVTYPRWYCG